MLFKIYCVPLHSFPTLYPSCSEHSHQLKKTRILQTLCMSLDTIKSYHSFTVTPIEKLDSKVIKTLHQQHCFKRGNNMIPEMLCPTALIVNTFSDLTLLQVCYRTDWQLRSCQSELYLLHKQGALEPLEEAWLAELFHSPIPTTNICLESSLKTLRRKMAARRTSASVT